MGDIKITWEQYPVKYNFITVRNDSSGRSDQLISGGIWLSEDYEEGIKNFVQGNSSSTDWIIPEIVVFYPKTRKLTYGVVGKSNIEMNCVIL